MTSGTSVSVQQEPSHHDELLMQQSLLFSDTLKGLKTLRKQLYSAAEYFEVAYIKEEQKQIVEESLKDYAIKALVNTVDHLGSIAYKVNNFLDEKLGEISGMDLCVSCLEQRMQTCQDFVNLGGLSQQSLVSEATKHHKKYRFPVGETMNNVAPTRHNFHHPTSMGTRLNSHQFKNIGIEAIAAESSSEFVRDEVFVLRSPVPQPLPRQGAPQLFTSISMNPGRDNRSTSPGQFPLPRSGSLLQKPTSPSHPNAKSRFPSEPRRTVSMSTLAERERDKDMEQYSTKSKRLFKAMLSLRKSRKDVAIDKFLDEN